MKGRVIRKIKGFYYVSNDNQVYECKLKGTLKVKNDKLNCIVGDIVEFKEDEKTIIKVYERENYLDRPLISNIDYLGITFSIKSPDFDYTNFQKILLNAYYKNITPLLILTKTDLVNEEYLDTFLKKFDINFKALDIKILPINIEDDNSINSIKDFISGKIVAFSGPSGVGKSTLINKILNEDILRIGDISERTERGKHTTTESRFFELDNSTLIVDTPGFSTLDFPKLKVKKELESLFPDFEEYSRSCKFRNCTHIIEPQCGVRKALEENLIPELRYSFYLYSFNNMF
ncbi:MAG: ribosome small subunit-dependent GTPase A [Sebaldella sp.]|nr:ribosome small subunit-dependent GTPase A [Sebaldella sp.]